MNWILLGTAIFCLYVGSNIPKAWEQWKAGTQMIRDDFVKKRITRQKLEQEEAAAKGEAK